MRYTSRSWRGSTSIERLQDSQFDVVLTDLRMGGATPASRAAAVERHRTETATVLRQLCPSSDC